MSIQRHDSGLLRIARIRRGGLGGDLALSSSPSRSGPRRLISGLPERLRHAKPCGQAGDAVGEVGAESDVELPAVPVQLGDAENRLLMIAKWQQLARDPHGPRILEADVPFIGLVNVHPSRWHDLREPDELSIEPVVPVTCYTDSFGNRCTRFLAPRGAIRLYNSTLIQDSGAPDPVNRPSVRVPQLPRARRCLICHVV